MFTKRTAAVLATVVAVAQARFGQEQIPIPAIAAVQGGAPGVAQTIAGAAVSDLLAASNACDKLKRGDQIIAELGNGTDSIAAAIGMVAAEKNFNPFIQSIPTICSDPTLPVTEVLRGITPLIDPAVGGSDIANALSAQTVKTPLDATGKSVADLLAENGFTNFTSQDASGNTGPAPAGDGSSDVVSAVASSAASETSIDCGAATSVAETATAVADVTTAVADVTTAVDIATTAAATTTAADEGTTVTVTVTVSDCGAATSAAATTSAVADVTTAISDTTTSTAAAATSAAASTGNATETSTVAGADFGLCVPTMKFEGGLDGRPATEFTFLPIDPLCAQGQQEALNPNIITNRICDQLTNVCEANDAAKTLCRSAQSQIEALGTRDKGTADTWNSLLGFAGAITNPDGGPAEPPATSATPAAKARMVRSWVA